MPNFLNLTVAFFVLLLVQVVAALPWLWLIDARWVRENLFRQGRILLFVLLAALVPAFVFSSNSDPTVLATWGRIYGAALHLQIREVSRLGGDVALRLRPTRHTGDRPRH